MNRLRVAVPLGLVLSAVVVAPAADGAGGPTATAARTKISVTATEFKFKLKPNSARHGKVTFSIKNSGNLAHDFKIAGKKTKKINPGSRRTLTVTLKKGKTYRYICTLPGHAASGMKGKLRVR